MIKEDGHMVTARQEPRLVLISVAGDNGCLTLSAPEMKDLQIPVKPSTKNPVWNCRWLDCLSISLVCLSQLGFKTSPCVSLTLAMIAVKSIRFLDAMNVQIFK